MSWTGKFLRVNLTTGKIAAEPLNMEWARQYLGQRGLATKYLASEIDPKVDPLSPDNKMIFTTGPLTGTAASTAGRYSVVTKGPLTGCIACSNSGGMFGNEMKNAGWDMIIVEGKAANPVYLYVENDKAELRDAGDFWGKTVWETESGLKARHQDPLLRIATIGAAGEKGALYACIINDMHRAAGRSGVGAVMGSKNLKAIALRGTKGVKVKDPQRFLKAAAEQKQVLADNAVTGKGLPAYGTQVLMNVINEVGAPRQSDGKPNLATNGACFGCTIACGRISQIDRGHFSVANRREYWHASGGLEYEAAWAMGADAGIDDLEALTFANFMCNEHGFDPISFGSTLAAAMELYEAGLITKEQTGGVELKFGSAEALVLMAELTGKGEGFGKELGLGSKRLCEKYGRPELSMTVKGQEFPAYDPRGIQGMGLTYATSNRGACHLRSYTVASEIMGIPVKTDPHATEGKAGLVKAPGDWPYLGAVIPGYARLNPFDADYWPWFWKHYRAVREPGIEQRVLPPREMA